MIGLIHRHFRFEDSLYSLSGLLSWVRLTNQCIDEANFISAYTIKRARTLKFSPNKINFDIKKELEEEVWRADALYDLGLELEWAKTETDQHSFNLPPTKARCNSRSSVFNAGSKLVHLYPNSGATHNYVYFVHYWANVSLT